MALSTVSRWLKRIGLGKRSPPRAARAAQPLRAKAPRRARPRRRQEARADRSGAGHRVTGQPQRQTAATGAERGCGVAGWEFVHVCVDDATRLAYVEVLADERGETAAGFLRRAVAWFASMGITVERVMSDNGSCYRSRVHAAACRELGLAPLLHPALPAAHQRQGRALHPDASQPVGLRRHLRQLGRAHRSAARLARPLQLQRDDMAPSATRPPAARLAELEQRHG